MYAENKDRVMKKVIEMNFKYFKAEENKYAIEVDLDEKKESKGNICMLPPIGSPRTLKYDVITENQPQYRWCWFERAENQVI